MPLIKSKSPAAFRTNVAEMIRAGHPRDQSLAAAYRILRGKADGGRTVNLDAAHGAMNLTPQERAFYERHLANLYGSGGVDNPDGSRSTLYQMSVGHDGRVYNVPTVWEGKILNPEDAMKRVQQEGWEKFPSYETEDAAEKRYQQMHGFMERDTADYFGHQGKANGGAIERLPDHYAEIGAARIEDRRNHDPTLRAMGIDKLKKRFGMKHSDAMMDSQRTEAEVVDRLVPRGHADGGAVLAPGFYAQGGSPYPQMWQPMAGGGTPWEVKAESRGMIPHSGYIPGSTGGRADTVPMGVKKGAYVVPADIVSALGDGNSQAGASKLGSMFGTAPYGAKTPRIRGTPLKTTRIIRQKFADGGPEMAEPPVADIIASHGEFVLSPEQLEARFGDLNLGHAAMDKLVENVRKKYAKKLRKLPGPKAG